MAKFKKGDRVVVLPRKEGQDVQGPHYVNRMLRYSGKVFTVKTQYIEGVYVLEGVDYNWHSDWLQHYIEDNV
jgi:hypothetical protein